MPTYTDRNGRKWNACTCLAQWLPVFEQELLRRGVIKHSIDVAQLIGGAPQSGGTHSKGGAFDIWQRDATTIKVAREMGAATWARTRAQGFDPHAHGVLNGCPHNGPARYQVAALKAGYNGLGGGGRGGRDDGPAPRSLRTWEQGIAWAKAQQKPNPTPAPVPKPRLIETKVATWNIPGADKIPNPADRVARAGHIIRTVAPGILGVQEAVGTNAGKPSRFAMDLTDALPGWSLVTPTTAFNENYLWLHDKQFRLARQLPDVIVRAKVGKRNVPGRHVTLAIVEHIASGRELLVANTHLVNDDPGGVNMQSRIVAGKVIEAAGGRPVAIVGDLNCTRTDGSKRTDFTPIGFTERGYVDTRLAGAAVSKADYDTYARYARTAPTRGQGWRIDRIHVKGGKDAPIEVRGHFHHLDVDGSGKFNQPRPSDHSLVYTSIRLP